MKGVGVKTVGILLTALAVLVVPVAAAQADEAAIKYRKAAMRVLGGHMGSMAAIAKKQVPHADHFAVHAKGLAETAALIGDVFPEGSDKMAGDTEATIAVWEKPEDFKAAVDMLVKASAKLSDAAAGGDMGATMAAFGEVGKSCKNCHDNFREKN